MEIALEKMAGITPIAWTIMVLQITLKYLISVQYLIVVQSGILPDASNRTGTKNNLIIVQCGIFHYYRR